MKYQETEIGKKSDFAAYVKKIVPELFGGRLAIEGHTVSLPTDCDLEYKLKYDTEETSGTLTLKVSWDYSSDEEDDDEVEVETE